MIYTVTMNPTLDITFELEEITFGEPVKAQRVIATPGGKGINVSRALRNMGVDSVAMGLLGGYRGEEVLDLLQKEGLILQVVKIKNPTRTNITILGLKDGNELAIRAAGPVVEEEETDRLVGLMLERAQAPEVLVLSGSLPPGVQPDIYRSLIGECRQKGIRVILDAVFNHCSNRHPFFRDLVEKGAASRYRGWFLPRGFPVDEEAVNYDTFAGLVREMPRWNTANDGVIDYLCGVAEFWTREADLDGWRLDVADELNHRLLRRLRERLEAVKPDVLLLGEIWNHAHRYVTACQLHAVTNYKFRTAALDFALQKTGARDFWNAGQANRMYYRTSTYPLLMNLLGSHDTARFATLLGDRSAAVALCALLLAMDGMPMLYYGDEVLMEGGVDPDNRRAMRWDLTQTPEAAEIRALMAFRGQSECLRKGSLRLVKAEGGLLAFSRETPGSRLVAAVNFGPEAGLEAPGRQLLGNARTRVGRAELPRNGYGIWEDESWSG